MVSISARSTLSVTPTTAITMPLSRAAAAMGAVYSLSRSAGAVVTSTHSRRMPTRREDVPLKSLSFITHSPPEVLLPPSFQGTPAISLCNVGWSRDELKATSNDAWFP